MRPYWLLLAGAILCCGHPRRTSDCSARMEPGAWESLRRVYATLPMRLSPTEGGAMKSGEPLTCIGVAAGDFDASGTTDLAVVVKPSNRQADVYALGAYRVTDGWRAVIIHRLPSDAMIEEVAAIPPGDYASAYTPREFEPGEVSEFHASQAGFVIKMKARAAFAFFPDGHRWVHLRIPPDDPRAAR